MCAALTFNTGVLLTGTDPVPQLPVNMIPFWTIWLLRDTNIKKEQQQTVLTIPCMNFTSAFSALLAGCWCGSSAVLSLSDSDLELLSESLELVDSNPLEFGASNKLLHTQTHKTP